MDESPIDVDGMENFDSDLISEEESTDLLQKYISNELAVDEEDKFDQTASNAMDRLYRNQLQQRSDTANFPKQQQPQLKTPKQIPLSKHLQGNIFGASYMGASKFLLTDTYQSRSKQHSMSRRYQEALMNQDMMRRRKVVEPVIWNKMAE